MVSIPQRPRYQHLVRRKSLSLILYNPLYFVAMVSQPVRYHLQTLKRAIQLPHTYPGRRRCLQHTNPPPLFWLPSHLPFRRPESPSPSSPASTIRPTTPTSTPTLGRPTTPTTSPTKPHTPLQSPSKLHNVTTPTLVGVEGDDDIQTVRHLTPSLTKRESYSSHSPTRNSPPLANKPALMNRMALGGTHWQSYLRRKSER